MGADITGGLAGAILPVLSTGPTGMLLAGLLGPVIADLAKELVARVMGPRQRVRVGATITYTVAKVDEGLKAGKVLRDDGFFASRELERAPAVEVAEGVLLVAQDEHEEKKLRYLGNLLGNLAFTREFDRGAANTLVGLARRLSYRQLCLLHVFGADTPSEGRMILRQESYMRRGPDPATHLALHEVWDLYVRGMVSAGPRDYPAMTSLIPRHLFTTGAGWALTRLMELQELPPQDVVSVTELLR